jgi:hypothetical protein
MVKKAESSQEASRMASMTSLQGKNDQSTLLQNRKSTVLSSDLALAPLDKETA